MWIPSSQVCELDIIFNFEKAYFILDEFLMGGEIQETSKQMVNRSIEASDMLQEVRYTLIHNSTTTTTQGVACIGGVWACNICCMARDH